MKIKPSGHSICVECREKIGDKPYYYSKSRGFPPTFIHQACYESLLPKDGVSKTDKEREFNVEKLTILNTGERFTYNGLESVCLGHQLQMVEVH